MSNAVCKISAILFISQCDKVSLIYSIKLLFSYVLQDITPDTCILIALLDYYGDDVQYIPRNMHTVFALLCFVVVIHWLIFPCPSGLLHWHCGNLTIAPVLAKQPWWIWINTSCEFIMNDSITTTKQSTTKPCAYFLGYTVDIQRGETHPSFWSTGKIAGQAFIKSMYNETCL